MKQVTQDIIKAAIAIQIAALEWDNDSSSEQSEAKLALNGLRIAHVRVMECIKEMALHTSNVLVS